MPDGDDREVFKLQNQRVHPFQEIKRFDRAVDLTLRRISASISGYSVVLLRQMASRHLIAWSGLFCSKKLFATLINTPHAPDAIWPQEIVSSYNVARCCRNFFCFRLCEPLDSWPSLVRACCRSGFTQDQASNTTKS
jgi:hypothetical protein